MIKPALFTITVLLSYSLSFAQTRAEEVRALMWSSEDTIFNVTDSPEKWQNEQAVILAISNDLAYKKFPLSKNLWEQNYTHIRVKILGQQALEEYAQFSYPESLTRYGFKGEIFVGFKVIKPDGQEIIIDEKEAVREELEKGSGAKFGMKKLAIPNLEIGDILDFYLSEELTFYTNKFHAFDPEIFLLRREYPILNGRISFNMLRRCFINIDTFNGAPEFEFVESEEKDESRYVLNYSDQESVDGVPYFYHYRSLPNVKFKVSYGSPMGVYQVPSLVYKDAPGVLRSEVSPEDLKTYITQYMGMLYDYSGIIKYMKKNFKGVTDHEVLVNEAYLFLRNKYAVQQAESYTVTGSGSPRFSSYRGIKSLMTYFNKAKIPYKLFLAVPRYVGDVEDILLEEEVVLGLKVLNPEIYIANFDVHALAGEISPIIEGTQVYMSNTSLNDNSYWKFELVDLPQSTKDINTNNSDLEVSLMLDEGKVAIDLTSTTTGHFKAAEQELVMDAYDYLEEEEGTYEMIGFVESSVSRSTRETRTKLVEEYKEERAKKKLEFLKTQAELGWDFEIDSVHSLEVVKSGRQLDNKEFEYNYTLESKDLVTKVGGNFLIKVGLLIESQIKIEQEHFENREFDVYMRFPRTYSSHISIEIPEGYTPQGVEQLNLEVQNETGGFVSVAKFEDGFLDISVKKYYSSNFEPKEKWEDLLSFIKAANDFTEQKILLRKQ